MKGFKHRHYWQSCIGKSIDVSMYAVRITVDKWEKVWGETTTTTTVTTTTKPPQNCEKNKKKIRK